MPRAVKDGPLRVGGRTVQVSSTARVLLPDDGATKGDLAEQGRQAPARSPRG
jgi:hypothetical protein